MPKRFLFISLPVLIILAAVVFFLTNGDRSGSSTGSPAQNEAMSETQTGGLAGASNYMDYDSEKLAEAGEGKNVVLFFKADWCITCVALDRDIIENSGQIPEDTLIMRVDFDTATGLRRQYDVRQQHTLVQVDSQGKTVKKWIQSPTLADVLDKIKTS